MNILLADDNMVFKEALIMFLESELKYKVIGAYNNGKELLESQKIPFADIVLLDIEMPVLNGILTGKRVNIDFPFKKLVAMTDFREKALLKDLIDTGFSGCVFKNDIYNKLEKVIIEVIKGNLSFPFEIKID